MSIFRRVQRIAKGKLYAWREGLEGSDSPEGIAPEDPPIEPADPREKEALRILELGPGASLEEIAKAHRALCRKYHPDRFAAESGDKVRDANELLQAVNAAYDYLKTKRGRG
jgi:DnaJ-domain-containing protein 1